MTKMTWTRPVTEVQQFAANEYVAACGDTEYGAYLFECNAPMQGPLAYFADLGSWEGVAIYKVNGTYSACGETHVADKTDEFYNGFIDANLNGQMDAGEEVIIWLPDGAFNVLGQAHATTNLNRESWEVTKS